MNELSSKVSIVLPTYNGSRYLRQSIESCLNQTYKNIELIIVDDGSTDITPEIIKSYSDTRIRYIRHQRNCGLPNALNTGFDYTTGEYLTWTSDDNYYSEKAIEKALFFLQEKGCHFVYCDYFTFNQENSSNLHLAKLSDILKMEKDNDVGPCVLYSRKVLETVGEFDPNAAMAEDYDYWVRVWKKFSMCHLAEPLYYYRIHRNSLTYSGFYQVKAARLYVLRKNKLPTVLYEQRFISFFANKYPKLHNLLEIIAKIVSTLIFKSNIATFLLLKGTQIYYKNHKKLNQR